MGWGNAHGEDITSSHTTCNPLSRSPRTPVGSKRPDLLLFFPIRRTFNGSPPSYFPRASLWHSGDSSPSTSLIAALNFLHIISHQSVRNTHPSLSHYLNTARALLRTASSPFHRAQRPPYRGRWFPPISRTPAKCSPTPFGLSHCRLRRLCLEPTENRLADGTLLPASLRFPLRSWFRQVNRSTQRAAQSLSTSQAHRRSRPPTR